MSKTALVLISQKTPETKRKRTGNPKLRPEETGGLKSNNKQPKED